MNRASQLVTGLLVRGVRAGVFAGAVAGWTSRGGKTDSVAIGHASLIPERRPVQAGDWFDLASLTKPLVVTSLFLIAQRGQGLRLETRLVEVLSDLKDSPVGQLTLRHLLTHSSGLPAWNPLYATCNGDPTRLTSVLARLPLEAAPGSRVVYSCMGFVLLGLVLERVLGDRLDRLFSNHVVKPLGLHNHLGYRPDPAQRRLATGALHPAAEQRMVANLGLDPKVVPVVSRGLPDDGNARFLGGVSGNSGLFGTVTGVVGLATCYLPGRGGLLGAPEIAQAASCHTHGLNQERGLGWQLAGTPGCSAGPALGRGAFGHVGFAGTSVWIDPAREMILVLLTNRHHPAHKESDLHPVRRRFHSHVLGRR